ncbi:hypothetical protein BRADI_2g35721v3 [Brachypodium distachyon]|uniref:Endonuclease/exonuclease/phosphatase domain-containing protein n=1 Tax=Brachypodium distachyon TaxID=15368 RepID=A0A2K2DBY9_BRADI|nr:hypothetical protein BRADI_2g35721v3 [Brachypodium distachyon]
MPRFRFHQFRHRLLLLIARQPSAEQPAESQLSPPPTALPPAVGHSGGLLIAVREDLFEFISSSQGDFFASMVIRNKLSRLQWEVLNVYGPVHYDRKAAFLAEIIDYVLQAQGPLLMGGDFNLIRFGDEKSKGALHKTAMVQFNAAIDMMQVRELHWVGCRFTWTNKQENPTFEVLDRAFMNGSWETLFPLAITDTLVRVGSDHNPLRS